jgi:hypothetical protein
MIKYTPDLIFLIGLLLALPGCGTIRINSEVQQVDIRGTVVEVHHMEAPGGERGAILGAVLIEGVVEEDTIYDKASITISRATDIFARVGEKPIPAAFDDVAVGQRAEVRFAGPVMETYPYQGMAAELLILSDVP